MVDLDAGVVAPIDAGSDLIDSGSPVQDSGTPRPDAGDPSPDAGSTIIDAGSPPPPDAGASGCIGVNVVPGNNLQAAIDTHVENTTFCLAAGVYRGQSLRPKSGDVFVGAGQGVTVLNGANLITNFGTEGALFFASGQTQENYVSGSCAPGYPVCNKPEILYLDDKPLQGVATKGEVSSGKYFFDYAADRVYFADNPAGRKVEVGAVNRAFSGQRPSPATKGGAINVTVKDLTVEKYAQSAQQGAIETNDGWLLLRVTTQLNGGQGITLFGDRARLSHSRVLRNGQIGVGACGGDGINDYGHASNAVFVEDTEIAFNNSNHYEAGWEAGGTKFWLTRGTVLAHNWVHHNAGPGLWDDGYNEDITFDGNLIEDNEQNGIFHEIGGKATITNNLIRRNGGTNGSLGGSTPIQTCMGAICISSGKNVTISNNYLVNNGRGIVLVDDPHFPDPTTGVSIFDNVVRESGDQAVSASLPAYNAKGGTLADFAVDRNHYTSGELFGFNGAARSFAEWQAYGKDKAGDQNGGAYAAPTAAGIR